MLPNNTVVWKKKDRFIRNMDELGDEIKVGIFLPIGYYRLNSKLDLSKGSPDSIRILTGLTRAPYQVFRTPLNMISCLKFEQWRKINNVIALSIGVYTVVIFLTLTGYPNVKWLAGIAILMTGCLILKHIIILIAAIHTLRTEHMGRKNIL